MSAAPSMTIARLQIGARSLWSKLEHWLDSERDQIGLWLPVALGCGIVLWFSLNHMLAWVAVILAGFGLGLGGIAVGYRRRFGNVLMVAGFCVALGCALAWWRAESVASPRLTRPLVAQFEANVTRIEAQSARQQSRVWMKPSTTSGLPPLIRVTVKDADMVTGLAVDDRVYLKARLVPPPDPPVPGGYDFARTAWFWGLGGTGSAIGPVLRLSPPRADGDGLRARLSAHVRRQIDGSAGGIAAAFASGDRGGIAPEDEEAMRASGLTHLLSISGLHITAVVAAVLFMTLRLLALSPVLALRWPLPLIAAGAGALAGIGYTALTGAEVPTIRSCIAAVLVLFGIALGREAVTLRLVATGAIIILLLWPEALMGPSFQLSFAAITVIVSLHEWRAVRDLTMPRSEGMLYRLWRGLLSLLLTGFAVELALAPIALFHFHKSGLYGAFANILAIPLTTFVTMPLEALALLFDLVGLGAPFWWLTGLSLELLLWISRLAAAAPGAVAAVPEIPRISMALMVGGGLWLLLWKTRVRLWACVPIAAGVVLAMLSPVPDLLITGDGRHLAVRSSGGSMHLLRPRSGDYIRDILAERLGTLDPLDDIDAAPNARCGRDLCTITVEDGTRNWQIAATRSDYLLPWRAFVSTCQAVDIIVSSRKLPPACRARWFVADRTTLRKTGGLAVSLSQRRIDQVLHAHDDHPWRRPPATRQ